MKSVHALMGVGVFLLVNSAMAQEGGTIISLDEWGHGIGTVGQGYFAPDIGPGASGLPVLTYALPWKNPIVGDVWLSEPGESTHSDLLRFNPDGTLVFYSDLDAVFEPADAPFPLANYPNPLSLIETDPFTLYSPAVGGPGFGDRGEYHFYSDMTLEVPDGGATFGILLLGMLSLFGLKRK
jgi:hypothetical protein